METTNDTAPASIDAVMRRVQKLLNIANDARANPAEAAAAAGQAERIMRKYQIDHADLIGKELNRGDSFGEEFMGAGINPDRAAGRHSLNRSTGVLSAAVAKLHDCHAQYVSEGANIKLRFMGYKADAAMARYTYLYLLGMMSADTRRFLRTRDTSNFHRLNTEAEAYRAGYISALMVELKRMQAEKTAEVAASKTGHALMVVKAKAVEDHFGPIRYQKSKQGAIRSFEGYEAGVRDGSKVDVGRRGVGNDTGGVTLRLK